MTTTMFCRVCGQPEYAGGACWEHYLEKVGARFWDRVDRTTASDTGCWIWTGPVSTKGYGHVVFGGAHGTQGAHRVAWILTTGEPLQPDTTLDHLCQMKACVNPEHLDPCSRQENARRWWASLPPEPAYPPAPERKAREWGRGSITERAPGVWQLRVPIAPDPITGQRRRHTETVHGTRRVALARLAELEANRSSTHATKSITLGQTIERWRTEAGHAPGTSANYDLAVRTIPAHLRSTPLAKLQTPALRELIRRVEKEHNPHRARAVHALLSGALRYAWEHEWIPANPMARVRVPPAPERLDTTPDADGVVRLLELVRDDLELHAWLLCLVDLGARRGEVLALRWSAVDLDAGRIRIRTTLDPVTHLEKDPKARQRRTVAIGPATVTALRRWRSATRERALAAGVPLVDDPYVFMAPSDFTGATPWRPDLGTRRFRRLADQVGLDNVRQHDLRHHVATVLLAAGVDPKTVAGRLGHTRVATTTDRYAHALPAPDRAAADVLAQLHHR